MEETIEDGSFVAFIAQDQGKIVATSGVCFYRMPPYCRCPNGNAAYIMNMYTLPEYRKQGIAEKLFKQLVEEARARGVTKISLNATDAGRPLYQKLGFTDSENDMLFCV